MPDLWKGCGTALPALLLGPLRRYRSWPLAERQLSDPDGGQAGALRTALRGRGVGSLKQIAAPPARRPAPGRVSGIVLVLALILGLSAPPSQALDSKVLESVVSVLPLWPGRGQGESGSSDRLDEPEGTAVAIQSGGYLVTALHVIGRAKEISVRLSDGRVLDASVLGRDPATDLAVLRIDEDLPVPEFGTRPGLASPVCAIGNQFGLDLSVTCGVVSATRRSGVGFNAVEDFIQTDAVVNPGASGGALVDPDGRLVGILSAIFTKDSDADIGVNFAVSLELTLRVVADLIAHGRVIRARSGLHVRDLTRAERRTAAGARVIRVSPGSVADRAGLQPDDLVISVAGRRIRQASDVTSAIQLHRPGETVSLHIRRRNELLSLTLELLQR